METPPKVKSEEITTLQIYKTDLDKFHELKPNRRTTNPEAFHLLLKSLEL